MGGRMTGWGNSRHNERRTVTGWEEQRRARRVLRAHAGICHVCGKPGAGQVDHVIPLAQGGADDIANLRPIHAEPCHREKTQREAKQARQRVSRRRPTPERHPGLVDPPKAA